MPFNDLSSLASYFTTRRSGRPRDMVAPGPDADTIRDMVAIAARTPDHGKLAPWRVVHVPPEQRDVFAEQLQAAYAMETANAGRLELESMASFARQAPQLLVVLFSPKIGVKIPLWEQQLSVGAFTMNLLHAVHAAGYVGGWITGWPSYSPMVRDMFGADPETIAGFIFIGSPGQPLEERPRPALDNIISTWVPLA